jgi:hypothetical protein
MKRLTRSNYLDKQDQETAMKYYFDNFDKLYDELIEEPFIRNSKESDKMDTVKKNISKPKGIVVL